jgi:phosphotransferase system HPr-like phosphotransfer protein
VIKREFILRWRLGGRASASLIRIAERFQSKITVECAGLKVDGKEVMGLLLLGGASQQPESPEGPGLKPGDRIEVQIEGVDAEMAMLSLTKLFEAPDFS